MHRRRLARRCRKQKRSHLELLITNASDQPIYAQIASQIQDAILSGELAEGEALPSIRSLANDLRISVITTKRAYAELEEAGFINTVQGKGTFVAGGNRELLREARLKHVEELLASAIKEAAATDVSAADLHAMLDALLEEG